MDFALTDEQQAVARPRRADPRRAGHPRARCEALEDERRARSTAPLWAALADAGLLGIAVPEDARRRGPRLPRGLPVLEQVGRTVAPVPVLRHGRARGAADRRVRHAPRSRPRCLPGVAAGDLVLTAALVEPGAEPAAPATTATPDGDGWRARRHQGLRARGPAGRRACSCRRRQRRRHRCWCSSSTRRPPASPVDPAGHDQRRPRGHARARRCRGRRRRRARRRGPAARRCSTGSIERRDGRRMCAITVGVCEAALRITAEYTKTREQFDRPIATFQAVGQRAADAYVDTEAIRLTTLQAAWRLSDGLPGRRRGRGGQVLGRRGRPAGRARRRSTCTAASASTATTRCTATSCSPSSSS